MLPAPRTPRLAFRLALALVLSLVGTGAARGATIVVASLADVDLDDAVCTLRESIVAANGDVAYHGCAAGGGADTISIPLTGTIHLVSPLPDITSDVIVAGPGAGALQITGDGGIPFIAVRGDGTVIEVEILDLAMGPGQASLGSAGVTASDAHLSLRRATFSGLETFGGGGGFGGAVLVDVGEGSLLVEDCDFSHNMASVAGGAITARVPTTIRRSTFTLNGSGSGGAVAFQMAEVTVERSRFEANSAETAGALFLFETGGILRSSTFLDNEAGTAGAVVATTSTPFVAVSIEGCTFARNMADGFGTTLAGAVGASGVLLGVHNSTFDANVADEGAAIFATNLSDVVVRHATITGHAGNGAVLTVDSSTTLHLDSSIVWENVGETCGGGGAATTEGYNLLPDLSCGAAASDLFLQDPLLGPLADNGGPVPTRYPAAASPAVGSGPPVDPESGAACLPVDARGISRPRNPDGTRGGVCDRGAVERTPSELFADGFEAGDTGAWS